jgi:hypothetical protein
LQVLTHTDVIAIPENSVSGFAGISFNGQRFQIKYLSKSKGTDAYRRGTPALCLPACAAAAKRSLRLGKRAATTTTTTRRRRRRRRRRAAGLGKIAHSSSGDE